MSTSEHPLNAEGMTAVLHGLMLLAEFSLKPSLVQHLTEEGRKRMVDYFARPSVMTLGELTEMISQIVEQAQKARQ